MRRFQSGITCIPSPTTLFWVPEPKLSKTMPALPDCTTGQWQPEMNGAAAKERVESGDRRSAGDEVERQRPGARGQAGEHQRRAGAGGDSDREREEADGGSGGERAFAEVFAQRA